MTNHDLYLEVGVDGRVRMETDGIKGKTCMTYVELLEAIVGEVVSCQRTADYDQPDSVSIDLSDHVAVRSRS